MKSILMQVGNQIRTIRQEKKISLRDFEKITGIARGELSNIETGKRNATLETIERIAKALGCRVEILIDPKK